MLVDELKWKAQDLWRDRRRWVITGAVAFVVVVLVIVVLGPRVTAGGEERPTASPTRVAPTSSPECVAALDGLRGSAEGLDVVNTYLEVRASSLSKDCSGELDLVGDDVQDLLLARAEPLTSPVDFQDCAGQEQALRASAPGDGRAVRAAFEAGACSDEGLARVLAQQLLVELEQASRGTA